MLFFAKENRLIPEMLSLPFLSVHVFRVTVCDVCLMLWWRGTSCRVREIGVDCCRCTKQCYLPAEGPPVISHDLWGPQVPQVVSESLRHTDTSQLMSSDLAQDQIIAECSLPLS